MLKDHLERVAQRTALYAAIYGSENEGYAAGLLHDLGKYGDLFQLRLQGKEKGLDHWSFGAWIALMKMKSIAAAMVIQGHHIGLQQLSPDDLRNLDPQKLRQRHPKDLRLTDADDEQIVKRLQKDGVNLPTQVLPPMLPNLQGLAASQMLDVRMLFSALVDADFIETEAHFHPDRIAVSQTPLFATEALQELTQYLDILKANSTAKKSVLSIREDLLRSCLAAADQPQGLFTLTAPTGTGKTYAMLAFALRHAVKHHLRRIVVVLPYLSIIDQTVRAYRSVLSESTLPVYEHHSLTGARTTPDPNPENGDEEGHDAGKWVTPNWDAPLIVTTSVQMLESLFSNRSSSCRKLHNLAGSVILFDEVQTLPLALAVPTLATLSRLAERFGASLVFSTATQPAFARLNTEVKKLCETGWQPIEIVPEDLHLFERARRTRVTWPKKDREVLPWSELARQVAGHGQALCIVNLKKHAYRLYDELKALGVDGLRHLSTNLCPMHRQNVLEDVHKRLSLGAPCLLVATQCVEAGVDLDFPIVYRAWGPLDAIAQAAGRCNRNGRHTTGDVIVFMPEEEAFPDKTYGRAVDVARLLGKEIGWEHLDIHDPAIFDRYYKLLYDFSRPGEQNPDLRNALEHRDFVEVAEHYRLIKHDAINVLVPYDPAEYKRLRDDLFRHGVKRSWIRQAQPHIVGLYRPRKDSPAWNWLKPAPFPGGRGSEEWFVWLKEDSYCAEKGLVIPEDEQVLIA